MNFSNGQLIQVIQECKRDDVGEWWKRLLDKVHNITDGRRWIFRALDSPQNKTDIKEVRAVDDYYVVDTTGKFTDVKIAVKSSFDIAWERRFTDDLTDREFYEAWMLSEFKRGAHHYQHHLPDDHDFLEWLALARHYGMPCRLVDFSYSFFVPCYFAMSGKRKGTHGFILALDYNWLKAKTEEWLQGCTGNQADMDFHNPNVFWQFAFVKKPKLVVPVNPSNRNERLINQQGLFLCPGRIGESFEANLEKTLGQVGEAVVRLICAHSALCQEAIRALRRMNVDMRVLYPDLSGFSQSLRDLVHEEIGNGVGHHRRYLRKVIDNTSWGSVK
ncbi:MAG: FRG domain-containing protein [candidate division NC10 bacterium]|nr:FRG domain-containing protein [candidate division NC10 bacterium]